MVAPELVAITAIILAPIAYLMSSPNARVTIGVIIIPPPIPKMAPMVPAKMPTSNMVKAVVSITKTPFYKASVK